MERQIDINLNQWFKLSGKYVYLESYGMWWN